MKKGYVILEIGWEYNDEYYSTGNNGEMYEAPNEVFTDKSLAKEEMLKREIKSFRGNNLSSYMGEDPEDYITNGDTDEFFKFVLDEFNMDISDDFYFDVPNDATDNQIKGLMKLLKIRFHSLKEITINE